MIFGKAINRYYFKYAHMLIFGIIALIAVDYFSLKIPELYRIIINALNGNVADFNIDYLLDEICRPMLIIILIMVAGRFLWRVCFFGAGIKIETDLRRRMFDNCKGLSQQYYQANKVGNLMSLFINDLETVQDCFGSGVLMTCDALFLGVLSVYKMAQMHGILTLFSLIPLVFLLIIGTIVGKKMSATWDKRQESFSRLSDFSQESFSGIAVIKAFVKELKELLAFKEINVENEKTNIDYTKISTILRILVTLFVESVICVILGYGGFLVYGGVFDAGQLVEFIGYFTSVVWPVMAISELIDMQSRGKASLKRISTLLESKPDVVDKPGVSELENVKGEIEFRHLSFKYPDGEVDALHDVSFKINPGENVGIIGKTGSGKTTIVDLILRTYNVPDGTLFIDGKDVNSVSINSVRKCAAYVPQDNFLFSDTVSNNISFASDVKTPELITLAAQNAAVADNINEFTDKYETVLGERGVTVSGGQKQRISIARALMKDAPVLIMDDSLSAVDTDTERTLLSNFAALRKNKTTILIAHRVTTIEKLDKIIYVEDGHIAAVGTHDELLESCPEYAKTVELQKLEETKGGNANA